MDGRFAIEFHLQKASKANRYCSAVLQIAVELLCVGDFGLLIMGGMHGAQEIQKAQPDAAALDACILSSTHGTLHQNMDCNKQVLGLACSRFELVDQ